MSKERVNNKLRKALKEELNEVFTLYVNGELQMTRDEIREHIETLKDMDIQDIRKEKCKLRGEIEKMLPDE